MSLYRTCGRCAPIDISWLGLAAPKEPAPVQHCYGEHDTPGIKGLIGSGVYCDCDCRRWPHKPNELYDLAASENPNDLPAIRDRYRELMVEHGHLIPAKPGENRNLPCGWPGVEAEFAGRPTAETPVDRNES